MCSDWLYGQPSARIVHHCVRSCRGCHVGTRRTGRAEPSLLLHSLGSNRWPYTDQSSGHSGGSLELEPRRVAITARIGRAHEHAALGITDDQLHFPVIDTRSTWHHPMS